MGRMVSSKRWICAVIAGVSMAVPAQALRLEHFVGTLSVEFAGLPPLVVAGDGHAQLDAAGSPFVSLLVPESAYTGATSAVLVDGTQFGESSQYFPIGEILLSVRNGAGVLMDGAGVMPLRGLYRACLWGACSAPVFSGLPTARVTVPFTRNGTQGVGIGGSVFARGGDAGNVTVVGAPWTTAPVTVPGPNGMTLMRAGSIETPNGGSNFAGAAQHGGVVQMVTPIAVYLGSGNQIPTQYGGIATLRVTFTPEPGTAVLVAAGLIGLVELGRRRRS
jgi:hypothetical protein